MSERRCRRLIADHGDTRELDDLSRAIVDVRERLVPGSLALATAYNIAGAAADERDDPGHAETLYRRAFALRETLLPESLEVVSSLFNLGILDRKRGDLARAEELFRRALVLADRIAPEGPDVARVLNSLAIVSRQRTDFSSAEEYSKRALALSERDSPDSLRVAGMLNNIGNIRIESGDLASAESYYRRSLAMRERLSPGGLDVASSLHNLGVVLDRMKKHEEAEALFRRAIALKERLAPSSIVLAESLDALGNVQSRRGELAEAERLLKEAAAIRATLAPGSTFEAQSRLNLGLLYRKWGKPGEAFESLEAAVATVETQRARLGGGAAAQTGFLASFRQAYQNLAEMLVERGRPADELISARDLTFGSGVPEELGRRARRIGAEYDRVAAQIAPSRPGADDGRKEKIERLDALRVKRHEVETEILKAVPRLAPVVRPEALDAAACEDALAPDTVLLSYGVSGEDEDPARGKTLLFVLRKDRPLVTHAISATRETLAREVEIFRSLLLRGRDVPLPEPALVAQGAHLFDILVRPALAEMSGAARVVIVPDDPLGNLPFAALVADASNPGRPRYFVEEHPLSVVSSGTLLAQLAKRRRSGPARAGPDLVAFGDPAYEAARVPGASEEALGGGLRSEVLSPLPFSRDEVTSIASLFPGKADVRVGKAATEEAAKALGRGPRFVHFACHAVINGRMPSDSALVLATPKGDRGSGDNGLLQAWEIFEELNIDADLVALSACDTALLQERSGEGLLGLVRAFQLAGARSVLASLWIVSDATTAEQMRTFYRGIKDGLPKDVALQRAQIAFLDRAGTPYSHPYRWAPFVLMGDGR